MSHSASSLPPSKRHTRLTVVRRGCELSRIAGIHGEAMYTAPDYPQGVCHIRKAAKLPTAVQSAGRAALQVPICQCAGSRGKAPRPFSRGFKGDTLFREREYPPFTHSRTVRESSSCTGAGKKLFYASGVRTPFSVTSIVQRISCSSTGTSGDMSCSRQMSTVGQWSCGSRRS